MIKKFFGVSLVFLLTFAVGLLFAPNTPTEGCTPGYWKNHVDVWANFGADPTATLDDEFDGPDGHAWWDDLKGTHLLNALYFHGGRGIEGAARIFLRQAVAALLNAKAYDLGEGPINFVGEWYIKQRVNGILGIDPLSRDIFLEEKGYLAAWNELGCPLNRDGLRDDS